MYSKSADAIKKTSSAEHLPSLLCGTGAFDGIWSSIQRTTESANDDVANAISDVTPPPPPPYIHPLVKRSASCLSEKSLEICTESLGSETGSDGFSSSSSELLVEEDKNEAVLVFAELEKEVGPTEEVLEAARPMRSVIKKAAGGAAGRPLPPPLPSLSSENLHMRSHRRDGRLVLEAVAVQGPRNCFRAERQGGRLLLTFSEIATSEEVAEGEGEDEQKEELMEKEKAMINYVPYKFLCMTRSNNASLSWPQRLNRAVTTLEEGDDDDRECQMATSAAMLVPAMSAEANTGALLNQYIYSWRNKRTSSVDKVGELKEIIVEEVAKRGPIEVYDKLLPFLRGCNDVGEGKQQPPRRPLVLLRDSKCIATS